MYASRGHLCDRVLAVWIIIGIPYMLPAIQNLRRFSASSRYPRNLRDSYAILYIQLNILKLGPGLFAMSLRCPPPDIAALQIRVPNILSRSMFLRSPVVLCTTIPLLGLNEHDFNSSVVGILVNIIITIILFSQ